MKVIQAIAVKLSKTKKSMLVGIKSSKYDSGYTFGWCANPDKLNPSKEKPIELKDFNPSGRVPIEGKTHENGEPVMKFVFA